MFHGVTGGLQKFMFAIVCVHVRLKYFTSFTQARLASHPYRNLPYFYIITVCVHHMMRLHMRTMLHAQCDVCSGYVRAVREDRETAAPIAP